VLVGLLVVSWRALRAREAELDTLPPLPGRAARPRAPVAAKPEATRAAP
jgi:hypothetical protein